MKDGFRVGDARRYYDENGYLHREDGPAVIFSDGEQAWFYHGKRHREDGPAIEFPNGIKFWYYNGKEMECSSQKEFDRIIKVKAFW
jgi:hypothetical protein